MRTFKVGPVTVNVEGLLFPRFWVEIFPGNSIGGSPYEEDQLGFGFYLDDEVYLSVYIPWRRPRPYGLDLTFPPDHRQRFQWRKPRSQVCP